MTLMSPESVPLALIWWALLFSVVLMALIFSTTFGSGTDFQYPKLVDTNF